MLSLMAIGAFAFLGPVGSFFLSLLLIVGFVIAVWKVIAESYRENKKHTEETDAWIRAHVRMDARLKVERPIRYWITTATMVFFLFSVAYLLYIRLPELFYTILAVCLYTYVKNKLRAKSA